MTDYLTNARSVFDVEIEALQSVRESLDGAFVQAAETILDCRGKVIVTGLGKSGAIARKFAATLSSTGTPAVFLHLAEGIHGDLGVIDSNDIVVGISYSGETGEISGLISTIRRLKVKLIAITGHLDSSLAKAADIAVPVAVPREACPLGLAPTSSTTASLALADALAVVVHQARGFTKEDFAMRHPGGSLGRSLLRVEDLMHTGDALPLAKSSDPLGTAILEMTRQKLGIVCIADEHGKLAGVITDGDLRRLLQSGDDKLLSKATGEAVLAKNPRTVQPDTLAVQALTIMEDNRITALIAVDADHRPTGVIHIHDILRSKVV